MPAACRSAPVTTASTPGAFAAAAVSTFVKEACACGERTKYACAWRRGWMSSV